METDRLIASLHPLEIKILKFLPKANELASLVKVSGMQEVEVLRALMWLKNKNAVNVGEGHVDKVNLDENGIKYREGILKSNIGLPEHRFLKQLEYAELKVAKSIDEIRKTSKLNNEEISVSIGVLRKKGAVEITPDKKFLITDAGKKLLKGGFDGELFLRKEFPVEISGLSQKEKEVLEELRQRKSIVKIVAAKIITYELTSLGRELCKMGISEKGFVDSLTPQILKSGGWKGKQFRRYDVKAPVPRIFAGRKQHYRRFIEDIREKFLSLGFVEMAGPIVETEFWNMDSLYMPQFHSARDIHDAYYIKDPEYASKNELPARIVENVKKAHESGFNTGSRGWRYNFDVKRTYRHVLRTQDTSISPRVLSSQNLKIPGKYFQIVRCFRYDVIDATHLPDFNQTGGFVVDKNLTLRHLFALLRLFAKEFAEADEIKVVPAYFPFTEPSAALYAKHPKMGWIELAGAGMFRPEMTHPLGVKEPVIAWGVGLERLAMFKLGLDDIRQLFSHDLEFLRNVRMI